MNQFFNPALDQEATSRRQAITRAFLTVGAIAGVTEIGAAEPAQEADSKHITHLHQEVTIAASPARVYECLMLEKQFTAMTGMPATIEPREGGTFSMFGGIIIGRTIELVKDRRIVQAWKPKYWDPGVYSLVHFELVPAGDGTKIVLDHSGFPEGTFAGLDSGWPERYWNPMKKYLA